MLARPLIIVGGDRICLPQVTRKETVEQNMKQVTGMKCDRDGYETGAKQTARQTLQNELRVNRAETGADTGAET